MEEAGKSCRYRCSEGTQFQSGGWQDISAAIGVRRCKEKHDTTIVAEEKISFR